MGKLISVILSVILTSSFSIIETSLSEATGDQSLKIVTLNNVQVEKPPATTTTLPKQTYQHGDCSYVSAIALKAGWAEENIEKLIEIIKRESGCCPNRKGGDMVDKNCKITGVSEWNHRSDTGLLQINGVHWLQTHKYYDGVVCKQMKICTQEPLLDPEINLRAGRLLYEIAGWTPWGKVVKTP